LSIQRNLPTYEGRKIDLVILTIAQLLIGAIHIFFGLLLLAFENFAFVQATFMYSSYTLIFGLMVMKFAFLIWQGKKFGWAGTIGVMFFVIVVDSLALLNLPSIPGIPKLPALIEIIYSLFVIFYLSQRHVREKFLFKS